MAAVSLLALGALLYRVGQHPLDVGYVRYLGIADEIVRSGDWVVLRKVDDLYLSKPPLFFWILAVPMALLGAVPNWVAHVAGLLALAIALLAVHRLARDVYGPGEPALSAVLVFATLWETFNQATGRRIDLLFVALLAAAFASFFLGAGGLRRGAHRPALLAGAWILVALATLTKGPLAIGFFLLGAGIFAAWTGRLRAFLSAGSLGGMALLAVLCAVWPALLAGSLGLDEAVAAYAKKSFTTRHAGVLVYLAHLPEQNLPWTLFFPALAVALFRRQATRGSDGLRFFLVWFLVIFVPLHLTTARHARYVLPASPALALLLISLWYAPRDATGPLPALVERLRRYGSLATFALLAVAGVGAGFGLALADREPFTGHAIPPEGFVAAPLSLAIGVAAALGFRSVRRRGVAETSLMPLATLVVAVTAVFSLLAAGDLRMQDHTPQARAALATVAEGRPAALFDLSEEQLQMSRLLTRRGLPRFRDPAEVAAWATAAAAEAPLVLTSPKGRQRLEALPGWRVEGSGEFELAQDPVEVLTLTPRP